MDHILETPRPLPVLGEYDVAVCGGGIAGIASALSSARQGAKTLLVEREYALGGLATLGLVTIYLPLDDGRGRQVSFGIAEELLKLSVSHGYEGRYPTLWMRDATREEREAGQRYEAQFNAQLFAILCEKLLLEAGVSILYGSTVCDAVKVGDRISYLTLENKSGRVAYRVRAVVDTTGDADLCRIAQEESAPYGVGNVLAAWYYSANAESRYKLKMLGYAEDPNKPDDVPQLSKRRYSGIEGEEVSGMVQDAHAFLLRDFLSDGDLSDTHILSTFATIPQLRMTRRVAGRATMTASDDHRPCEESVGLFSNWRKRGPVYELPFGALRGKSLSNLFFAGRCLSADDTLWDITRVIPVCSVSGEAAGIAAAIAATGKDPTASGVQQVLRGRNVPLHEKEIV